jgi:hypothetical protein
MVLAPHSSAGLVNDAAGLISVTGPGGMSVTTGPFTSSGAVSVSASRLLQRTGNFVQTGGTTAVDGELRCTSGSVLLQGGRLSGNGLVNAAVSNTGGAVAPGSSPGNLRVQGGYTQGAQGTLEIEIAGTGAGEFDHLAVTGDASLNGTLAVRFLAGYAPVPGDSFRVLDTTGARTGTFAGVTLVGAPASIGVDVQYDAVGATIVLVRGCGSADFNCDGDLGTDADIAAFFQCLAGNCPAAPCTSTADFNADGDLGTDADIASFFRVLAGGGC